MTTRTVISDNGVTRLEAGLLTGSDVSTAHSLVMGATYDYTTGVGKMPADSFPTATRADAWHNEIECAVEGEGGAFAAGLWLCASSIAEGNLVGVVLARPRAGAPADALVIRFESALDEQRGGTALSSFACREAEARGKRLVRRVERVDWVAVDDRTEPVVTPQNSGGPGEEE